MLSSQLGAAQLGDIQLGSDGIAASPALLFDGPTTGNQQVDSSDFTVTYVNPGVSILVSFASSEVSDTLSVSSATLSIANPTATFHLVAPTQIGERTISITNDGGLSNPADIIYGVFPASSVTSMLGPAALGNVRLGADAGVFTPGIAQLYLRPAAVMHGGAGIQSGAMVVGVANPPDGVDVHVVMQSSGIAGTWSSGATLNGANREALVYVTPAAGTSGDMTISATADQGVLPPAESLIYTVDGNAFYISAAGNDANNGQSQLTPWATALYAQNRGVTRGAFFYHRGGDTFAAAYNIADGVSGANAADLITLTSYGTGRATLTASRGSAVSVSNSGGVKVDSLIIDGVTVGVQLLLLFTGSAATTLYAMSVTNCEVKNGLYGISFKHTAAVTVNDPTVTDCDVHDCQVAALDMQSSARVQGVYTFVNPVIRRNKFRSISGNTTMQFQSAQSVAVYIVDMTGCDFGLNLVHDCGTGATNGGGGVVTANHHNGRIYSNELYNHFGPGGTDASGIDLDFGTSNTVVELNFVSRCDGAGLVAFEFTAGATNPWGTTKIWSDNHYRFNVVQNCAVKDFGAFAFFGDGITNCFVYNNTFVVTAGGGNDIIHYNTSIAAASAAVGIWFLNNVMLGSSSSVKIVTMPAGAGSNANQHWLNNAYYVGGSSPVFSWRGSTYTGVAAWQAGTGQDANAITANPALNAPFTTVTLDNPALISAMSQFTPSSSGSPVVGTGLNLTQAPYSFGGIANAINGQQASRGNQYDVGAAKFIASLISGGAFLVQNSANQEVVA